MSSLLFTGSEKEQILYSLEASSSPEALHRKNTEPPWADDPLANALLSSPLPLAGSPRGAPGELPIRAVLRPIAVNNKNRQKGKEVTIGKIGEGR